MPHIHTEPGQFDLTVSAFIFKQTATEPVVLLHQHKRYQVWMQPGGHVELNETPWQALIHELREETGYDIDQLALLQPPIRPRQVTVGNRHPQVVCVHSVKVDSQLMHFHTDLVWAFVTGEDPRHEVGKNESTQLAWFGRQALVELPRTEIYDDVCDTALHIFDDLLASWELVPTDHFRP
jgi:8-oxo-dGTP pyrophosphatase MutT (NUDIX family)